MELDRPQTSVYHGACALHAGNLKLHTETHNTYQSFLLPTDAQEKRELFSKRSTKIYIKIKIASVGNKKTLIIRVSTVLYKCENHNMYYDCFFHYNNG